MDKDRQILTQNMRKLPSTGIRHIDDVHNFIWDLRMQGKPCTSLKLKPTHFAVYAHFCSKLVGRDKIYDKSGQIAAPIECDGVQILEGDANQFAYILPNFLPIDHANADKWRDFQDKFGFLPEHHSQVN